MRGAFLGPGPDQVRDRGRAAVIGNLGADERGGARRGVLAVEHRVDQHPLTSPEFVVRPVALLVQQLLADVDGAGSVRGNVIRDLERGRECAAGFGQSIDEAKSVGTLGCQRCARERQLGTQLM